jgi:hypothetical protein
MAMSETQNKPTMTVWDKQVVAHLSNLVELDKAGKLEFIPIEQVFTNAYKTLDAIQARQRAK